MTRTLLTLAALAAAAPAWAAGEPLVLDVWPGKPPGDVPAGEETFVPGKPGQREVKRLTNVSKPTIKVFRPAPERDTGTAVVICPGGGYNILAWDLEGEEVAAWLDTLGVTGVVLKYRVPRPAGAPKDQPPVGPLQDVQRALSLVRSKAGEWNLRPDRVGVLGFSAGGHLAASASTNFDRRSYEPIDAVDKVDCRPDFAVLVYPGGLLAKSGDGLAPEIRVSAQTPPTFFAHAADDKPEHSVLMYKALHAAKVPAELHVYADGGHGFGLRPSDRAVSTWPARCADWLGSRGLLSPAKK